ncbi:MAG: maltose alpha-D-glucosyltransferase [Dehalococcoidales bacterium]|nr:maltose alpha-D-glucosyltransferase [Dehalococcoidales bacterium]
MSPRAKEYFWQDSDPLWYKDAIIYELHPRAFYDSNGDGIGDFPGLTEKLNYLQDLGINTIWLLPFYPSPLKDDGYDISSYTSIQPEYGTIRDFTLLLREADARGLRVITELVLNHTSDQHPWFQRARRAKKRSRLRDFYVWSDSPDKYKDARIIFKDFELSNWSFDPLARAYYWHRFYSHQPDLNYDNPQVQKAMIKAINFWLSMGISGLRLDAVPYLYERDGTNCENLEETHAFLKKLRHELDGHFQNRMLLAEANQWSEDAIAYFGDGDECHMAYHFPLMPRLFMAIRREDRFPIIDILQHTPAISDTCQWALFLRNHDELTLEMVTDEERDYMYRVYAFDPQARVNLGIRRRLAPLLNNDRRKIELMNGLLFSLPGTPVLYYGDEIGMGDNFYLGDRNGVRTPMQWSPEKNAGFSNANPQRLYLPPIIDPEYHYQAINVENQQNNADSLLWWTKRLIAQRKRFQAFGRGSLEFVQADNRKILAFTRHFQEETVLVVANLSRLAQHVNLALAADVGKIPVEVFGQSDFPIIGNSPYSLTLSPFAFYWFSLESRQPIEISPTATPAGLPVPVLRIKGDWMNLLKREIRPFLATVLLNHMRQKRWFGGKARQARAASIRDFVSIPFHDSSAQFIFLNIEYTEGDPETYLIPLAFASGERANEIASESPQSVIARVELKNRGKNSEGIIFDALIENDFTAALLEAIARRRRWKGQEGRIVAFPTSAFQKLRGPATETLSQTVLKTEQTNTSIMYGDRLMLKLFRRVEEGTSPELEIGRFLTEKVSFPNAPPVAGALEYHNRLIPEPVTLGILHGYVPNEGDAWRYTLDELGFFFDRVLAHPEVASPPFMKGSLFDIIEMSIPVAAEETIGSYLVSVQRLAQRTAELHLTMASASIDARFTPEPFSLAYQRSLFHSMRSYTNQVLRLLQQRLTKLPDDARPNAKAILDEENTIIQRFQRITGQSITGMRIRCHGDYHLGQVLYTGDDFVITDFEGEPARYLTERRIKRSPLRDVAGMIRSFHYAAYAALRNRASPVLRPEDLPILEEWSKVWYLWVSVAFLKAYLELISDLPILPATKEGKKVLFDAYLMEKALYEVNYELNNRPNWVNLPLQGVRQMLEAEE